MRRSRSNRTRRQFAEATPSVPEVLTAVGPPRRRRHDALALVFLSLVTVAVLLPFIGKALHIDDPLFAWSAERILESPWDFYGFTVNWQGHPAPMAEVTKNPPLACYYLAAAAAVFGWREPALHGAFMLAAVAAVLGTYAIARRLTAAPLIASLIALATPVFVVSATTLMSDVLMLAFWCWAIVLWMRGVETRRHGNLAAAGLLVTLAALTKYFALCLIPLLAAYAIYRARRPRLELLWLLVPLGAMLLYDRMTALHYGHGLLGTAAEFAAEHGGTTRQQTIAPAMRLSIGVIFFGGCLLTTGFYAPQLWSRRGWLIGLGLVVWLAIMFHGTRSWSGWELPSEGAQRSGTLAQMVLFAAVGVQLVVLTLADFWRRRDADSLLLGLWLLGTLIFAALVNWTVNGRSILPAAPAAAILVVRRLETMWPRALDQRSWRLWLPIVPGLALALAVAWADMQMANSARTAADVIWRKYGNLGVPVWFQGHWGFQYYMQRHGAQAVDLDGEHLLVGQIMVVPLNNDGVVILPDVAVDELKRLELPAGRWISTLSEQTGAGFYTSRRGPLPLVIGRAPPETYQVYAMKQNVSLKRRPR